MGKVSQEIHLTAIVDWLAAITQGSHAIDDSNPRLVESWESRTATLHHFTWHGSTLPDVVVKVHNTANEAATHFHSMRDVALALEKAPRSHVAMLSPSGFSGDLRAVLMPYVEGRCLSDVIVYGRWSSSAFRTSTFKLVRNCGEILASYHEGATEAAESVRRAAQERLESRLTIALDRSVQLADLTLGTPVVKRYGDFHPGHILVTATGQLALLDPPIEVRHEYIYRDLAAFSYNLSMALIHPSSFFRNPLRARYMRSLVREFLNGYTDGASRRLTEDDFLLINGYEAFFFRRMLDSSRKVSLRRFAYYGALVWRTIHELRRIVDERLERLSSLESRHGFDDTSSRY